MMSAMRREREKSLVAVSHEKGTFPLGPMEGRKTSSVTNKKLSTDSS